MNSRLIVQSVLVLAAAGLGLAGAHSPCPLCCAASAFGAEPDKSIPKDTPAGDAQEKVTLKVGDAAPALKADKWVKGSEVKAFEKGRVYVVEFWATWCKPCREAIPHLTEIAKSHKGELTVIGVASSERKGDSGEDKRLEKLEAFVKQQGDQMDYVVAYDGARKMGESWLGAAGRHSIPTAFVVGADGKIAWVGEPDELGEQVEKALAAAKKG